jgi:RNA polymerase sigma-70 factor (ECF subfamily)
MTVMDHGLDAALREARAGSQAAFGELWRAWSPAVCGFLRAKGAHDPESTTSEVFLGGFEALDDFVGDAGQFRALLFTIAQRRVVDELRRRSRRPVEVEWTAELDDRCDDSAEQRALAWQGESDARTLLDGLPPDQKDVLVLRIFGDLTVDQIAAALGKTPGAVKQLQRRGLDNLRRRVGAARPVDLAAERS